MRLPWLYYGVGPEQTAVSLTDFPAAPLLMGLICVATACGALAALLHQPRGASVAAFGAASLTGAVGVFVVAIETADMLVPPVADLLAARGEGVGVGAGEGAWLAFGVLAGAALLASSSATERARVVLTRARARGATATVALVGLAAALVGIVQLRLEPWIGPPRIHAALQPEQLVATWASTTSAIAGWLLVWGVALALQGWWEQGALVAAGAGWLTNASAATVVAVTAAFAGGEAHPLTAIWLLFGLGLAIALAAAVALSCGAEPR